MNEEKKRMEKDFHIRPRIRCGMMPEILLAMKHIGVFISGLPDIIDADRLSLYPIIRHPIEVLRSWSRLDLPVSHGNLPAAEFYSPELRTLTHSNVDLLTKQVLMYDWYLKRCNELQHNIHVLRYEDIVADPYCLLQHAGVLA